MAMAMAKSFVVVPNEWSRVCFRKPGYQFSHPEPRIIRLVKKTVRRVNDVVIKINISELANDAGEVAE